MYFCRQNKETSSCPQQGGTPPPTPTKPNNQILMYFEILAIKIHWQCSKTVKFSSCVMFCNRPLFPDFPASVCEGFPPHPPSRTVRIQCNCTWSYVLFQVKQPSVIETKFWQWKRILTWSVTAFWIVSVRIGCQLRCGNFGNSSCLLAGMFSQSLSWLSLKCTKKKDCINIQNIVLQ